MAKTYQQMMTEARQQVPEVSPDEAKARLADGKKPVLLDVREREEFRQGYIPDAVSIPRGFLEIASRTVPDKKAPSSRYCASGARSLLAGRILKELGYEDVVSMRGGFNAWKNQGMPITMDRQFTAEQADPLQPPLPAARGGRGRTGEAPRRQGAAHRRGRPRLARGSTWRPPAWGRWHRRRTSSISRTCSVSPAHQRPHRDVEVESARITLQALNPDVRIVEFREAPDLRERSASSSSSTSS